MPAATNTQMQRFADERLRPFAEALRDIFAQAVDHQAAIDDVYARATANPGTRWNDARTDGPPHLLQNAYDNTTPANPDDMLNFNTLLARLGQLKNGTFANVSEANEFAALWAVLQDACVRALVA